jgi:PAS domain S-box-containing protein
MALLTRNRRRHIVIQSPIAFNHPVSEVASVDTTAGSLDLSDVVLRLAFDQLPVGIAVSGLDGRWRRTNEWCRKMLGYADADLVGPLSRDLTHPDDALLDQGFVAAALAGVRTSIERDKRYARSDGTIMWTRVLTQLVRDDGGDPLYFVSFLQDLSGSRRAEALLHESERTLRAVIDNTPATISVKDRDHRYTLVNREFEEKHRTSSSRVVGRPDSDIVPADEIEEVHAREREVFDTGRSSQQEKTAIRDGAEQILLVTRFPLRDETGAIAGVCTASTDVSGQRRAERAKHERLECSALIYSAIAEHRLVLHAQPILNLSSMRSATAELLIRMRASPDSSELLPPATFLPAAERHGLIGVVDDWVVDQAIGLATIGHRVSVNLSAQTVSDPALIDHIEARVAAARGAVSNLIFEITETAIAEDLDAARSFATRLRALGCGLSLDDFGVGHGSFTYLRHLPVDYLKIDAQFVRDLLTDEEDRQVVQAIIGVARQFDLKTVAEGVEDEPTLLELRALGADYVQGYLTGRPMPLAECWKSQMSDVPGETHVRSN